MNATGDRIPDYQASPQPSMWHRMLDRVGRACEWLETYAPQDFGDFTELTRTKRGGWGEDDVRLQQERRFERER